MSCNSPVWVLEMLRAKIFEQLKWVRSLEWFLSEQAMFPAFAGLFSPCRFFSSSSSSFIIIIIIFFSSSPFLILFFFFLLIFSFSFSSFLFSHFLVIFFYSFSFLLFYFRLIFFFFLFYFSSCFLLLPLDCRARFQIPSRICKSVFSGGTSPVLY